MEHFEVRSRVQAPADVVWSRVTTPEGINDELMPIMRMTMPASMHGRGLADVAPGDHLGRSWLLLFGVVPFDYDDVTITAIEPGHFLEQSTMMSMRSWQHERTITADADGAIVSDRITFKLRSPLVHVPGLARLLHRAIERMFRHRHRRVVRYFRSS